MTSSSGTSRAEQPVLEVRDCYGFLLKVTLEQQQQRMKCNEFMEHRESKWERYFKKRSFPESQKLKRYLRKGVPPSMRPWVWMEISGAIQKRFQSPPGYYKELVRQGEAEPNSVTNQIDLDLPRTFPGAHQWLSSEDGQRMLRRVLLAYSIHNTAVGYCQSMNYVAALLILAMGKAEEDAFWLLVAILDGLLYPGMYANNLEGCHVEMKSLAKMLGKKDSKLAAHMDKLGCDMNLVATDWFLCLFCTTLPIELLINLTLQTAARVWDSMLFEGPKILYRVALALFQMADTQLRQTDNPGDFLITMRTLVQTCYDRDDLMHIAFDKLGSLRMDKISKYRREKQLVVDEEMQRREAISRRKSLNRTIQKETAKGVGYAERLNGGAPGPASTPSHG